MHLTHARSSILFLLSIALSFAISLTLANPVELGFIQERSSEEESLWKRTEFPDNPPSCILCERDYDSISSCANASVVFSNVASILFNPMSFIDVIECACVDTFRSAYPQCVDCFIQTNQTGFLVPENGNLSSVVTGMREICALGSSIFGGVGSANSQLPGQTAITPSRDGALSRFSLMMRMDGLGVALFSVLLGFGMGVWTVL